MLTLFLFIDMIKNCCLDEVLASKAYVSSLMESVFKFGFDCSAIVQLMACCLLQFSFDLSFKMSYFITFTVCSASTSCTFIPSVSFGNIALDSFL